MQYQAVLYSSILCSTKLFCAVLFCVILCWSKQFCLVLCSFPLRKEIFCSLQLGSAQYCAVLYRSVLCSDVLCCAVLCCSVQYCVLCFSSLCFCFLEEFLEKEEAEVVEGLLVNWHMGPGTLQVFRYCTLDESR